MTKDAKQEWSDGLRRIPLLVVLAILAAFVFRSVLFAPFFVPSGSMMPVLRVGDFFVASRYDYGISPRSFVATASARPMLGKALPDRGDIVVFLNPSDLRQKMVKRVVGLPGDRIEVIAGVLKINGSDVVRSIAPDFLAKVEPGVSCVVVPGVVDQNDHAADGEEACRFGRAVETLPGGESFATIDIAPAHSDFFPATVVPADSIFVMGDNRDDSLDSRFPRWEGGVGFVPVDNLMGKLRFVIGNNEAGARFMGMRKLPDRL